MQIKIITNVDNLPNFNIDKPIFCDIETQGLYINPRLIQFYQPAMDDIVYIVDLAPVGYKQDDYIANLAKIKDIISEYYLIFYNASYDLGTLGIIPKKLDDLFYAVRTAYPQFMEFGLDKVVVKLGYGNMYNGLDKKALQKAGFVLGAYLSQAQFKYSAIDVIVLSLMYSNPKIKNVMETNTAYIVDIKSLIYAVQYQQNGLVVDTDKRLKLLEEGIIERDNLQKELPLFNKVDKTFMDYNPEAIGKQYQPMNVNSYKQVRAFLDTDKSDADALVRYSLSDRPKAKYGKLIIALKAKKKQVSYLESIDYPKMYTHFNPAGASTGRFTSTGGDRKDAFNSQQIPRTFGGLFKADAIIDGVETTVVGLDYTTLELRLACTIFGEPTMYKQLIDGEDLHTSMAKAITGKELHPDGNLVKLMVAGESDKVHKTSEYISDIDRLRAKGVNFGYVFGMSAKTFRNYAFTSYGVELSEKEANDIRDAYFRKYPRFKAYHNNVWENYQKADFVYTTPLGRKVKPKLGTDGINGPVQGGGAETTKLAVHYLIKEHPEAIKYIFNVVHDAIYLRVPKVDKAIWYDRLSKAMVKGWTEISKTDMFIYKDIPMPVDV